MASDKSESKTDKQLSDRGKALDTALARIVRQFGKGSIIKMGERTAVPMQVVPTGSTALDITLGIGGLPRGRIVEIYGPESSGKRTVALHAIAIANANATAQKNGDITAFIDAEHALDSGDPLQIISGSPTW